jgi:hypothetical protein
MEARVLTAVYKNCIGKSTRMFLNVFKVLGKVAEYTSKWRNLTSSTFQKLDMGICDPLR